jgi:ubiquinone/menaquinone biosynthesis C-methylase UbiE
MRGDENVNDRLQIQERAVDADCLDQRILENQRHQKVDLVRWIFERIHLEPGSRVLELCSGTGNQTMKMIELVGDNGFVVATDISEKALNQLKEKVDSSFQAHLTTVTAPMDDLPKALEGAGLEKDRFDIIFCAYGLYYSDNPIKVLEECACRLYAKGRLVVVGPFGPNNAPLFKCLE